MSAGAPDRAADAAARRAAQTVFGAPLAITAGAGTGKTTVLVARVVAWCLGAGWERAERACAKPDGVAVAAREVAEYALERVVAITFTEAAAAEMEARTMAALAQVAAGEAVLGYDTAADGDAGARRARAHALLAAFDRLHVQTIHAFCRRVLANHPLEAGMHPRFRVDARGAERAAAVREVLEVRLRSMADDGDPDLEAALLHGVGAPEVAEMLEALLAAAVSPDAFAADPLAPDRVAAFAAELRTAADGFLRAVGERFAALPAKATGRAIFEAAVALRERLATGLQTSADLVTLVADLAQQWPPGALARLGEWGRGKWSAKSERDAAGEALEAIGAAALPLRSLLRYAVTVDAPLLALLHRTLEPLLAAASQRLREVGAESFDALLRKTRDLLVQRPDVAERVRRDIDQLLVDEFQDTDALQCEIVATLALSGDAAARPGLFLVGDPKQSVYGWRNADIGAYMDFVARVCAEPGAVAHTLCVNQRSVPAVLDEVASVVAPAMRFEPRVQPLFEALLPSERNAATAGSGRANLAAVEYWVSADWDREAGALAPKTTAQRALRREAENLARDLRSVHDAHALRWRDVALLFRSTGDLDEYMSALREAEIPYTVDRDRSYYRRREVVEAAALVRSVLDPSDQIAQVAVLRSAWVGVPDAAWRPLWDAHFPDALRDALDGVAGARARLDAIATDVAHAVATLEVPGLASIAGWEASLLHALEVLIALRRSWIEEPVDAFIEKLRVLPLLEATEAARHPGAFRLANLARFFRELAVSLESGDAAAVLRELRRDASGDPEFYEGRPQDPAEDAVQVMTIHGAKGLDFEHVYVLQLHKGAATNTSAALVHAEIDGRLEWRLAAGGVAVASLGFEAVQTRRKQIESAELVRTLYVALTRAKSRLVLAGCFDGARGASHANFVMDARGAALRAAAEQPATAASAVVTAAGARVVFLDALPAGVAAEPPEVQASEIVSASRVEADALRLLAARDEAAARERRAFGGRASAQVPDSNREDRVARDAAADAGDRQTSAPLSEQAEVAAAVGTALHAILERFDWNAAPDAEWERQRVWLREWLERRVAASRVDAALERASALAVKLAAGSLWTRLRELAPHVLARELPVLVRAAANGTGPVGYVAGAIDLVYRDPASGEIVVADFKTDRVAQPREIAERVAHHRPQGELYRRAALETLRLPRAPRLELWFLDAQRVEVLEFEPAPGEARAETLISTEARS
jgi:ATP-dependent helicase/nuclease subunit A